MAIRDHLDPDVRKKLGQKKARPEPEQAGRKAVNLKPIYLLIRVLAIFIAVFLLNQAYGLGLFKWLTGDDTPRDDAAENSTEGMIVEDAALQWIDETIILIVGIAVLGALAGLVLAKLRSRQSSSLAALMAEARAEAPDEDTKLGTPDKTP